MCSLLKMERTWVPTVLGDRPSWLAADRLVCPELTSSATLRSASVSASQPSAGHARTSGRAAHLARRIPAWRSVRSTVCRAARAPAWSNASHAWSSSRTPAARDPAGPVSSAVP
jgi:hypothetical protein